MRIDRVYDYYHLRRDDLEPPPLSQVFFDPADTEIGAWVGADLITPGCTIIDLACGSGAAVAAFARAGAGHAWGVDIAEPSVTWARTTYGREDPNCRVSFVLGDFTTMSPEALRRACPAARPPSVITSNPAYVPLGPVGGPFPQSIDGGPDGLRFVRAILTHAVQLQTDLGLTLGSYSSPGRAAALVDAAGFCIEGVTLASLPLGPFTRAHPEAILALKAAGEAVLWRSASRDELGYLIVGMTCRRRRERPCNRSHLLASELVTLLEIACASPGPELEALESAPPDHFPGVSVRVLVLPDPKTRQHW